MKKLKILFNCFLIIGVIGCTSDDERNTDFLKNTEAPKNLDLSFKLTQDNSGLVIITPTGEGATQFEIFLGDDNSSVILNPGESISNTYSEGTYDVQLIATGINGLKTEYSESLTVAFRAPENLEVEISYVDGDVFSISISASAEFEAYFEFFPGVSEDEEPIQFMEGETITFTYEDIGTYEVKVVAYSGGDATVEYTETISILNPLLLPINFEDPTLNYNFIDFGGAASSVVENPNLTDANASATVAQSIKTEGAEIFAGTVLQLDETLDFSALNKIKIDVYSPTNNIILKLKIENISDPNISSEIDVVNSLVNEWETLIFDFSGADLTQEYQKIILFFDFGKVGNGNTYYFDNIELTNSNGGDSPNAAAPTPTASDVISLFSDAYTDVPVDTWNTVWSQSGFEDILIEGNATKKYFDLGFNGIETVTTSVDAEGAGMTHFHMDVWTPNITAFRIKIVDFLGNGFEGSNGDTEAELSFSPEQGQWVGIDIPLADFAVAGMTSFTDINQYIISSNPFGEGVIFIDNVYFYNSSTITSTAPTAAAPTPTLPGSQVISMFSDPYTDVVVDTWNTSWSNSNFEDITIAGNATKLYTNLGFNGIETVASPINASGMTHFHMDIWTPNITSFRIKLVDFLGDGFQGSNGDTEAELSFTPSQGGWISLDIPLSDFTNAGMSSISDINQYIISCDPYEAGTVYIDNVYFHN